jgi:hypothetical protein
MIYGGRASPPALHFSFAGTGTDGGQGRQPSRRPNPRNLMYADIGRALAHAAELRQALTYYVIARPRGVDAREEPYVLSKQATHRSLTSRNTPYSIMVGREVSSA